MNNGKICVSVCAETIGKLVESIKRAAAFADVVEIRFDCLSEAEIRKTNYRLPDFGKQFLVAFRPREQGGRRDLSLFERLTFWQLLFFNNARKKFIADTEFDINEAINPENIQTLASFHDFAGTSEGELFRRYEIFKLTNEKIIKLAARAFDVTDAIPIWKLLERAVSDDRRIIPIAMGESGKWTRILGLAHGSFMTYAALESGRETAPGQISAQDLIEVYRVKELNERTEIYGVVAGDTSYSMSPYMHNAAFKFHNLNAVFVPLQVNDLDEFARRMVKRETREIELDFKGFAVTNPHKRKIIEHLDETDETARAVGAVNTVKIGADGKLFGFNTDAAGFIEPLKNAFGDLRGARAAILGAGGAARACVYALQKEGAETTIFARDQKKTESLAEEFKARGAKFKVAGESYDEFDILVNATPLGTKGELENRSPAAAGQIEKVKLVYDLVYNPFETAFIKEAKKVFVPTVGGLAMLVAQAIEQQKIWTGLDAPMKEMSRAVLERLK